MYAFRLSHAIERGVQFSGSRTRGIHFQLRFSEKKERPPAVTGNKFCCVSNGREKERDKKNMRISYEDCPLIK